MLHVRELSQKWLQKIKNASETLAYAEQFTLLPGVSYTLKVTICQGEKC
jgi:hypothetical protein